MSKGRTPKHKLALTLAAVATSALGACAGSQAALDPSSAGVNSAGEMQTFLDEAGSAAASYGRKHLGHYLELDQKALEKQGLAIPDGIALKMTTEHDGYCIRAHDSGLAASNPWSTATVSSGVGGVSDSDSCKS